MQNTKRLLAVLLVGFLFSLSACTKTGSDSSSGNGGGSSNGSNNDGNASEGGRSVTDCGVVSNGSLKNPVDFADGQEANVRDVFSANLLAVELFDKLGTSEGTILVKLQGVASSNADNAINFLERETSGTVRFFKATKDCNYTTPDGGQGTIGSLVTSDNLSVAEEMIKRGLASAETGDACNGDLIGSCLQALEGTELETAGEVGELLWKPQSDSNSKLAVHSAPSGTTVIVSGETGTNQGGGNGFGSLARFTKPGCAYGGARVKVLSSDGGVYTFNGATELAIPNPCQRYRWIDGSLKAENK